jgi:hypothetical protein
VQRTSVADAGQGFREEEYGGLLYDVERYKAASHKSDSVYRLIVTLWNICVLRFGPQALPDSRSTLPWIVVLHLLVGTAYNLPLTDFPHALQLELAGLLFAYAFVRLVLMLAHRSERFEKALGALLGSDVIISSVGLLLETILVRGLGLEALWNSTGWLLMAWSYIVTAHIFRHVFAVGFGVGIIIAFAFFFTSLMFMVLLQSGMGGT